MELFRIFGKIVIDSKAAIAELDKATKEAQKSSTKVADAFSKMGKKSKELGEKSTALGQKFAGVSLAAGGLLTSLVATTETTRDYRTEQGKLETAFETSGFSASAATKTFESLQGVLGEIDQSVEAANHLAKLCNTEEELSTWTDICTGVFATFGDSLPIEGLTEAANETAKVGVVTGSLADALNWAGVSEDEFNAKLAECSSEQERQKLITSTLNGLYKDSAAAYQENNKQVIEANEAQENLTNSLASLAEKIEPLVTKVKNLAATIIEKFAGMNDGVFTFIVSVLAIVTALSPVLIGFGAVASSIGSLVKGFGLLKKAFVVAKVAFSALGKALLANPIGIVIIAITALVAAFIYLWNNCEEFREFWINLWDRIKAIAVSVKDKIVSTFKQMKTSVVNVFNGIKSTATSVWRGVKNAIIKPIQEAQDKVKSIIKKIKGLFPLSIGKIFSNLKLPKISVSGGKAPYGIGGKGSLPSFSVTWNKKGAIFDQPTIFATPLGLQGVGEAGMEAVAPIDVLQQYVSDAVASQTAGQTALLQQMLAVLQVIAQKDGSVYLSGKEVGKILNKELGVLY